MEDQIRYVAKSFKSNAGHYKYVVAIKMRKQMQQEVTSSND